MEEDAAHELPDDNSSKTSHNARLLSASLEGVTFLILLQVGARALTFAANQLLVRRLSPELLGIATQLEIYLISVLYFARESLRVALQRQASLPDEDGRNDNSLPRKGDQQRLAALTPAQRVQTIVNLSYVSIVLGVFLAIGLAQLYFSSAGPGVLKAPYFRESLVLYAFASVLELCSEPSFTVVQHKMLYRARAWTESAAAFTKCLGTCGLVLFAAKKGRDVGLLPFAAGQVAYAFVLFVLYYWHTRPVAVHDGFSLMALPVRSRDTGAYLLGYFSRSLLSLGGSIFVQSTVKHILTQGDSLLIAALASLQDQGVYALVSNYGGLIARMLFQPVEEASRNLFAKLLSTSARLPPEKKRVEAARNVLTVILRLYLLLAITAMGFGPSFAPLLLKLVAGPKWTSTGASAALRIYCYYIPLLAVNGVTEAFISAVATPSELHVQSVWMFAFSVGFASAGFAFLKVLNWGAQGLVCANVVNMSLRIIWSGNFIARYFWRNGSAFSLKTILPNLGALAVGVGAAAVLSRMDRSSSSTIGGSMGKVFVAIPSFLVMLVFEHRFLYDCYRTLLPSFKT